MKNRNLKANRIGWKENRRLHNTIVTHLDFGGDEKCDNKSATESHT